MKNILYLIFVLLPFLSFGQFGIVTSVTGGSYSGFGGDGSLATSTSVMCNQLEGITGDTAGNIYISDTHNYRIRKVNASTGIITTVAGNGKGFLR